MATQFVYDFHLAGEVLKNWGYRPGTPEYRELIRTLSLIHAIKHEKEDKDTNSDDSAEDDQ